MNTNSERNKEVKDAWFEGYRAGAKSTAFGPNELEAWLKSPTFKKLKENKK